MSETKDSALECPNGKETLKSLWGMLCRRIGNSLKEEDYFDAAHITRMLLGQIDFESKTNNLSRDCNLMLKEKCLKKYAFIVDDTEGVNNYANGAESLFRIRNPESLKWRSSFDEISDSQLLALLPTNSVTPDEHDVVIKCEDSSGSNCEKDEVINSLGFLNNLRLTDSETAAEKVNQEAALKNISNIVSNSKSIWKSICDKEASVNKSLAKPSIVKVNNPLQNENVSNFDRRIGPSQFNEPSTSHFNGPSTSHFNGSSTSHFNGPSTSQSIESSTQFNKSRPLSQNGDKKQRVLVQSTLTKSLKRKLTSDSEEEEKKKSYPSFQASNQRKTYSANSYSEEKKKSYSSFQGAHQRKGTANIDSNEKNSYSSFQTAHQMMDTGSLDSGAKKKSYPTFQAANQMKETANVDREEKKSSPSFQTAHQMMGPSNFKNQGQNAVTQKHLGMRKGINAKFTTPVMNAKSEEQPEQKVSIPPELADERLKNIDPKMVEIMLNEIMDHDTPLSWDDIAGLAFVKKTLMEIVVWPMLRPDLFTGLRGPPKGILLFGPPGTGKTLIGKCVASQSKSTFFSISASSLGSKWVGDGEKLVRALFAVARCYQPAVIFIDEIDSLLIQRSDTEHESSRRIKTEFLVQLDGVKTSNEERLLIIGATNRPQELDEAARRRLVKRLYIPLPETDARKQIIKTLLQSHSNQLSEEDMKVICQKTEGYSGADMANLCKEAALGPIRSIDFDKIAFISSDQVRPIHLDDFLDALKQVRASVSDTDLGSYEEWNRKYGSS